MAKEWPENGHSGRNPSGVGEPVTDRLTQLLLEADLYLAEGKVDEARVRLSAALASLPLGDKRRAIVRFRLGLVELEAGDYDAALDHLADARRAYEKAGLHDRVRACLWGKATAKIALGDWEAAIQELQTLHNGYEAEGQTDTAEWVSELMTALQAGLPMQRVRRIARAKPLDSDETSILDRLLSRLAKMDLDRKG
jgi:tetratricopeptide (TPR) repeat protein